jgi:hypothetical protein
MNTKAPTQARKAPKRAPPLSSLLTRQSQPAAALIHCKGGPFAGRKLYLCTENDISTLYFEWNGEIGRYKGDITGVEWQPLPNAQAAQLAQLADIQREPDTMKPNRKQAAQAAQEAPGAAPAAQDKPTPYRPPQALLDAAQRAQAAERAAKMAQVAPAQKRAPREGEKVAKGNSHVDLAAAPQETAQEADARQAAAAAHKLDGEAAAHLRALAQEAAQEPAQVAAALARHAAQEAAQEAAQAAAQEPAQEPTQEAAALDAGPLEPAAAALAWAGRAAECAALARAAQAAAAAAAQVAAQACR